MVELIADGLNTGLVERAACGVVVIRITGNTTSLLSGSLAGFSQTDPPSYKDRESSYEKPYLQSSGVS
ncbi:hypothetical protein PENANT_c001G02169 [Penicillium antarcticum]|uniref:Uncharacterized protein n=1 Tax=Penicillium antarcticum TaxID=416450 RepID=A0A1V6QN69_9EURO|nr:hypothetical protein PENANT_c001G02169 [Penicillium antarcticum]